MDMRFAEPPAWLKSRVRVDFGPLNVGRQAVDLDVSYRGVVPFWRGWWLVEVALRRPPDCGHVAIKICGAEGKRRTIDVVIPLATARSSKRLFFLDWRVRTLQIQPAPAGEVYEFHRLRLAPVLPQFAVRQMYGLLATGSRDLRGRPVRDLGYLLPDIRTERRRTAQRLYEKYQEAVDASLGGATKLYERWMEVVEPRLLREAERTDPAGPRLSIIMPVHNPPERHLRSAIESVLAQSYGNWELCIADDASSNDTSRSVIGEYQSQESRIKAIFLEAHRHISGASNAALGLATGDYVTFLDHDDALHLSALGEVASALQRDPDLDIVYSDEDFLDASGNRCMPHFKSDWNPYLLYSHNYVTHLCVYRRSLVEEAGAFRRGVEGAQDYDLLLRCWALTEASRIHHIPKILYHWRMSDSSSAADARNKAYTHAAGVKALRDHFAAAGTPVSVASTGSDNFYRVTFRMPKPDPLVTLVVPTRDQLDILAHCIDGLLRRTRYANVEILIVDNGSSEPATLRYLSRIAERPNVRVAGLDEAFNFARICNFAASLAQGEILGFMNNDVDVINDDWLDEMVMLARRADVGCVGAKLYYTDDTVQHAGVILGLDGYAAHSHRCFPRGSGGYFNRLKVRQNVSAVTGACLVVKKSVYEQVGGMDERLAVAYNDVDFCLRVLDAGYLNVFTPFAELYHFESKTRGYDDTAEKQARFQREKDYLRQKWGDRISLDPYYNPNLTHAREDFSIGF